MSPLMSWFKTSHINICRHFTLCFWQILWRCKANTKFQFVPKSFPWESHFSLYSRLSACLPSTLWLCCTPSPASLNIYCTTLPSSSLRQDHVFWLRLTNLKQSPCLSLPWLRLQASHHIVPLAGYLLPEVSSVVLEVWVTKLVKLFKWCSYKQVGLN